MLDLTNPAMLAVWLPVLVNNLISWPIASFADLARPSSHQTSGTRAEVLGSS